MTDHNENVTDGKYAARALEIIDVGEWNDIPIVNLYFELLDGPDTGEVVRYSGFMDGEKAKYVAKDLKIAGWQGTCAADLENPEGLGIKVKVDISHYTSKSGKERQSVKIYKWTDASEAAGRFDALFAGAHQEHAAYQAEARQRDNEESPFG